MIKFLPAVVIGVVIVVVIGGLVYLRFFRQSQIQSRPLVGSTGAVSLQDEISNAGSVEERVHILETAILDIAKQLGNLKSTVEKQKGSGGGSKLVSVDQSAADLQSKIDNLQQQITVLKQSSPSPQSISKVPIYIPLGSGGEPIGTTGWSNADGYRVSINSADYPGYSSIQLEISLSIAQLVGTQNAQLFNITDNLAVSNTQISGNAASGYTLLTSGKGQLSNGVKTYQLQIYSSQGYGISIREARIKINF